MPTVSLSRSYREESKMHWACLLAYATPKSHSRTPVAKRISGGGERSGRTVRTGVSKHLAIRHELFPRTARAQRIARSRKGIHPQSVGKAVVAAFGHPEANCAERILDFLALSGPNRLATATLEAVERRSAAVLHKSALQIRR